MTEFLVKLFVKDYEHTSKVSVRAAYGTLSAAVGIFCNVLLFVVKATVGVLIHSISVTADAFNNLSDAGSSILSLIGVKMAEKPADEEHPFGHGRMEYITALVVAFLVLQVGFTFFKDAVSKILDPEQIRFQLVPVLVLILSIGVKIWLGAFNRRLGKRIDSKVMLAVAADAMGDVLTTGATVFSLLFFRFTGINIDGFVGLGVAGVVIYAGFGIARDTLKPLIGEAVSPEVYREITRFVESYDGIVGSHDLIVHNYGPGNSMASIHAEVPNDVDIETSHEIIDRIEREIRKEKGLFLVIHMDPIETKDEQVLRAKKEVEDILRELEPAAGIHDFRMVTGDRHTNLIFDMVVPHEYGELQIRGLKDKVKDKVREKNGQYDCVITAEKAFVSGKEN